MGSDLNNLIDARSRRDEWSQNPDRTFYTKEQIKSRFGNTEVIFLEEKGWNGALALGSPKHRHALNVIVRKT